MVKTVKKGSITIFLALILSLILSLVSASIESVRMSAARTQILNSMDIGLYSLFGQYDLSLIHIWVSIQGVRDYLGHSSENMTKQYIDFMPERIVSAEDKYFSKNQSFKLKGAEDDER